MKNLTKKIEASHRTAIYTALFGKSEHTINGRGKRPNLPELDATRRLPYHWDWENTNHTFLTNIEGANFSLARREQLEKRLHQLKSHKPDSSENRDWSAEITRRVAAGDFS